MKGRVNADLDSLSKILDNNYNNKFECEIESTYAETLYANNQIVDDIIEQMKIDFHAKPKEKIKPLNYWGHIHEKNMSTNTHNHTNTYVSELYMWRFLKDLEVLFLNQD